MPPDKLKLAAMGSGRVSCGGRAVEFLRLDRFWVAQYVFIASLDV